jgi:hypothetical protein
VYEKRVDIDGDVDWFHLEWRGCGWRLRFSLQVDATERVVRQELPFTSSAAVKLSQSDSGNSKHFRTLLTYDNRSAQDLAASRKDPSIARD